VEFKTALLKEDDSKAGTFVGYASTWTREPDSYGDVVAKGAFKDTLADWEKRGAPIPCLWGHRMDEPECFIGAVTAAEEDDHGLKVSVTLDLDNPKAAQTHRLMKASMVTQMSFAFDILDSGTVQVEDGVKARELRKVTLYEVSVVPVGANQDTSIEDVKGGPALTAAQWAAITRWAKAAGDEDTSTSSGDDTSTDGGQDDESPDFTAEQIKALRELADEWIADHDEDDPQEGEGDGNSTPAEAAQEGGKAARLEAIARLTNEINALMGQEGAGA